jgi:hypothetical protein
MIELPENAKVGRIIAKEKFYGKTDTATKNLFQNEIARITWEYKLAPETINLPAKHWPEIEVFRITLKNYDLPNKVLKVIDSAIPYPILFFVEKGTAKKAVICYKEQNQKNENTTKVDTYFETEWNDKKLSNIKIDGLDIDTVFGNFVRQIAGERYTSINTTTDNNASTTIKEDVEKIKEREKIQKQIDALTRKINSEPSIGKKQELAEERFRLKQLLK